MKLYLCSSVITDNLVKDFEKFLGRSDETLKVIFVTTAGNPVEDKSWIQEDLDSLKKFTNWNVEKVDIEKIRGKELRSKLENSEILWMNGGYPGYLMKKIESSGLKEYLFELLEKGLVYIGSSAGSMIMGNSLDVAEWYIGEEEIGASKIKPFSLLDFEIYPHYEDSLLGEIKKKTKKYHKYCLLKNGQAIAYKEEGYKIHGGKAEFLEN